MYWGDWTKTDPVWGLNSYCPRQKYFCLGDYHQGDRGCRGPMPRDRTYRRGCREGKRIHCSSRCHGAWQGAACCQDKYGAVVDRSGERWGLHTGGGARLPPWWEPARAAVRPRERGTAEKPGRTWTAGAAWSARAAGKGGCLRAPKKRARCHLSEAAGIFPFIHRAAHRNWGQPETAGQDDWGAGAPGLAGPVSPGAAVAAVAGCRCTTRWGKGMPMPASAKARSIMKRRSLAICRASAPWA